MAKRSWYKRVWGRLVITILALLLISFCIGVIFEGRNSSSNDMALALLAGISAFVAVGQWFFPFSSGDPEQFVLPQAKNLVRDSASFRMGDAEAANFGYIAEPIKNAFDVAKQALYNASIGSGAKNGILILGTANAGKTRLAFEALVKTLPNWEVLLWNPAYDALSKVPKFARSGSSHIIIFVDDLQEYAPLESGLSGKSATAEINAIVSDNRIATLQAILANLYRKKHLIIVATCRLEDEARVGAKLRWLFDQLQVITLPSFKTEITDPESATVMSLFLQHGAPHPEDWDGTLGSLVLGLSKKRSQYEGLMQSYRLAATVLHAMKLLSLAHIAVHTESRIRGICASVYGELSIKENTKVWQEIIDQLTQLQFVAEVRDEISDNFALVIRKDAYFDNVMVDYPAPNRPHQLDLHFKQLEEVFVELNDSSALLDLANTLQRMKKSEEALVAYDQVLRLDPTSGRACLNKGSTLRDLARSEEALAAYDQAILLDSNSSTLTFLAYFLKGNVLDGELNRHEEALATYEQALGSYTAHPLDNDDHTVVIALLYNTSRILIILKQFERALEASKIAIDAGPNSDLAYSSQGEALNSLKRYEEALVAFDHAIRLNPDNTFAYSGKGEALHGLKRYEEALIALNHAIRLYPTYADHYTRKGKVLNMLKQYEEALVVLEEAIRLDPNAAIAIKAKGSALAALKRYEEALIAIDQSAQCDPNDYLIFGMKGFILVILKRYEEAIAAFEQAIVLDSTKASTSIYSSQVDELRNRKRHEEALAALEQAIHLDPTNASLYSDKGVTLEKLEQYEEALAAFDQAILLTPTDASVYMSKGVALSKLERYEEALATLEQAIHLDPTNASLYSDKGAALSKLERYEEALTAFDQAILLVPTDASVYMSKGAALSKLERYEEALAAFEQVIHLDPTNAAAYNNKGFSLGILNRYEEALAAYDQAIILDPTDIYAYNNKSDLLIEARRYEEALVVFEQVIRLDPTDVALLYAKGTILDHLERYEEALAAFEQAIHLDPTAATSYYNKGVALSKLERYEEALTAFEQAIRLDPTDATSYYNKGVALSKLRRNKEARAAFKQATRLNPNHTAARNNVELRSLRKSIAKPFTLFLKKIFIS